MIKAKYKIKARRRDKIRKRIRAKVSGTTKCPRLFIRKSNKYIYAQIINDEQQKVIYGVSTLKPELKKELKSTKDTNAAKLLGKDIGKILKKKKIKKIVFDRNIYPFEGKIKAFADLVKENGIKF